MCASSHRTAIAFPARLGVSFPPSPTHRHRRRQTFARPVIDLSHADPQRVEAKRSTFTRSPTRRAGTSRWQVSLVPKSPGPIRPSFCSPTLRHPRPAHRFYCSVFGSARICKRRAGARAQLMLTCCPDGGSSRSCMGYACARVVALPAMCVCASSVAPLSPRCCEPT